ncbi:MAG: hypothetical protein WDA25_08285 [Paracoccaceae bacterium]
MTMTRKPPNLLAASAALLATTALGLPAFAETSVPFGAPKEAYIEALADMEPVEFILQSFTGPGATNSRAVELYAQLIEEYSGGKIQPEIFYASSIIAGNAAPAVKDGRLSYGMIIAQYDPSNMPVGALMVDLTLVSKTPPILGMLHSWGTMVETAHATPEAWEEQRRYGIEPGYLITGAVPSGIFCREPFTSLDQLRGKQVSTGGIVHAQQAESLGMAGVAIQFQEVYEGLQRGVIDCAVTSVNVAEVTGIIPIAPYHIIGQHTGFSQPNVNYAFDEMLWEDLPLAGRQLLFDLQKDYIEESIMRSWTVIQQGVNSHYEAGGAVITMDEAAEARLQAYNDSVIEATRSNRFLADPDAFVDRLLATSDKWESILTELGYADLDPGWEEFATWYEYGKVDLGPFMDRFFQDAMLPYRPE